MLAIGSTMVATIACGGETETVVQTVLVEVEKEVIQTVIVEKEIAKIQVATPTQRPESEDTGPKPGTLVVADISVPAPTYRNGLLAWPAAVKIRQWGFTDALMSPDPTVESPARGEPVAGIATAWEIAPDRSKITFTIRDDVEFHGGLGTLTANDVAFSMNDVISEGSIYARRGEFEQWVDNWEVIDDTTVVVNIRNDALDANWWNNLTWSNAPSMFSEKVFQDKGVDSAHRTMVGTGPWEVTSWTQNEEINASAVVGHWRQEPRMQNLQILEIPEASTRIAAWKTGAVDIAFIPLAFVADALDSVGGSWTTTISQPRGQHIAFAGNYWIQEPHDPEIVTPEEVYPRPGLDKSLPWVGDPQDQASMDQAKLVRTALALAIDRDTIANGVLKGFARPMTGWLFPEDSEYFKDEWQIGYNQERAKELLVEAGYPNGFTMPLVVPPDSAAVNVQVGQAVAQMWSNLGIDIELKSTAYSVNRASLVDRSSNSPWLMHDKNFVQPPDRAFAMSVLATRGFNFGIELDKVSSTYVKNRAELDRDTRIQNNIELEDWLHEWMPWAPAVHQFEIWAVRPEVVEWRPLGDDENTANHLETALVER